MINKIPAKDLTDNQVIDILKSDDPRNFARKQFSSRSASIKQKNAQKTPLSPIELRRQELEAAEAVAAEGILFSRILNLEPINIDNRKICDIINDVNDAINNAGIEFGENDFSILGLTPNSKPECLFPDYRWIHCSAVRGSNEGFYIHICAMPSNWDNKPPILIASSKTWTWNSALLIAAAATKLLSG